MNPSGSEFHDTTNRANEPMMAGYELEKFETRAEDLENDSQYGYV